MSLVEKQSYFSQLIYSWTWSKHGQRVSNTWLPVCREWVHGAGDQRTWLINLLSLSWNWCDLYLALSYFLGLGIMRLVWFVSCLILLLCARYHETGAIDISPLALGETGALCILPYITALVSLSWNWCNWYLTTLCSCRRSSGWLCDPELHSRQTSPDDLQGCPFARPTPSSISTSQVVCFKNPTTSPVLAKIL